MAKSKYEQKVLSKLNYIIRWAESGTTNDEIAKLLGISRSTLQDYRRKYPEFRAALDGAKEAADAVVENSAFALANGFVKTIKKPVKRRIADIDVIEYVDEEIFVPPNPTAQIFWLKNRKPDKWNDKITVEHGGSVDVNIEAIVKDLTGDEY